MSDDNVRKSDDSPAPTLDLETYRTMVEMKRFGNRAVRKAQAENRRLGIPNAYSRRGRLYFELPDGTLTEEDPFDDTHSPDAANGPEDSSE